MRFRSKIFFLFVAGAFLFSTTGCSRLGYWWKWFRGESQGTLVIAIGMTLDEVRKQSSLPLKKEYYKNYEWMKEKNPRSHLLTTTPEGIVFDVVIQGTQLKFEKCAYYWLETGEKDDPHLVYINLGLSPHKLTLEEVQANMRETERKFREDEWNSEANGKWRKGNVSARFYAKEHEVRTRFEKPVEGPNYFQVLEMKADEK